MTTANDAAIRLIKRIRRKGDIYQIPEGEFVATLGISRDELCDKLKVFTVDDHRELRSALNLDKFDYRPQEERREDLVKSSGLSLRTISRREDASIQAFVSQCLKASVDFDDASPSLKEEASLVGLSPRELSEGLISVIDQIEKLDEQRKLLQTQWNNYVAEINARRI